MCSSQVSDLPLPCLFFNLFAVFCSDLKFSNFPFFRVLILSFVPSCLLLSPSTELFISIIVFISVLKFPLGCFSLPRLSVFHLFQVFCDCSWNYFYLGCLYLCRMILISLSLWCWLPFIVFCSFSLRSCSWCDELFSIESWTFLYYIMKLWILFKLCVLAVFF